MSALLGVLAIVGALLLTFVLLALGAGFVERSWDRWDK